MPIVMCPRFLRLFARFLLAPGLLLLVLAALAASVLPAAAQPAQGQSQATAPAIAASVSRIETGERIEFFTTSGQLSPDGRTWRLRIDGRVYLPVHSHVRKAIIAQALKTGFGVAPDRADAMRFDERVDQLLGANKADRQVAVMIAGRTLVLPPSASDGHFSGTIDIQADDPAIAAANGQLSYQALLPPRQVQPFTGTVLLLARQGRSIISDIDDTVKITHVLDRRKMLEATFVKPFEAVPGMSRLYQTWASEGAGLHFLSSSPWHLYAPLAAFLQEAGFPPATLTLKKARLTDTSIQYLFADPTKNKPPEIEDRLKAYPERTFVLIGDSGEKDPEIYADFLRRYPQRIERVFIRNVTNASPDDARFAKLFAGLDAVRWQLFRSPDELPQSLRPR